MKASSRVRFESSNSGDGEVVDSVISKTTDYMFGNEVFAGFHLVRG
jgi:hypothetical protein